MQTLEKKQDFQMNGFNKFLNKIKNEIINLIEINYKKNYFNKHFFFFKKIFFLFKNLFIKFN
jgi:16S rRNA G527 N7-methylase RsmG